MTLEPAGRSSPGRSTRRRRRRAVEVNGPHRALARGGSTRRPSGSGCGGPLPPGRPPSARRRRAVASPRRAVRDGRPARTVDRRGGSLRAVCSCSPRARSVATSAWARIELLPPRRLRSARSSSSVFSGRRPRGCRRRPARRPARGRGGPEVSSRRRPARDRVPRAHPGPRSSVSRDDLGRRPGLAVEGRLVAWAFSRAAASPRLWAAAGSGGQADGHGHERRRRAGEVA